MQDWDEQLTEAIQDCESLLFAMTEDSVRSGSGCKLEWAWALRYKKPVIPVRVDPDVELPFRLGSRQFVDFSDRLRARTGRAAGQSAVAAHTRGTTAASWRSGSRKQSASCHTPILVSGRGSSVS